MIPSLAVVGHPNKGKSSIVATLSENNQVRISPMPGTTRSADHFTLMIDGEPLYDLIDTPGFQRAGQVHQWLHAHETDASSRPELVQKFVNQHAGQDKFADECALLQPILAGAGILYVVDGSKPYGGEYELEMDILRWTGRPRMALINMIGSGDHLEAWRAGLGQYFSIVREFNAHRASFSQRIALLNAFAELEEDWRAPLHRAARALERERARQLQQASTAIADFLQSALTARVDQRIAPGASAESVGADLTGRLKQRIQATEKRCQSEVQRIYRHQSAAISSAQLELVNTDIFTEQSWQLFGLSRLQLVATGAASGAIAGGTLDLLLGGTSLFLGSLLGGAVGTVTAWFGGPELAKVKILGQAVGGDLATAGPIRDANFPWVLLGRACLHHALISERNHAVREQVVAELGQTEGFFDFLDNAERAQIERLFYGMRRGDIGAGEKLVPLIQKVLGRKKEVS
ncbi:MAG: GTPase/DUF3482 domain-containing protein [Pseudomonadota bacterium]